jgi:hypothetical protein
VVDVFYTARALRLQRPGMVQTVVSAERVAIGIITQLQYTKPLSNYEILGIPELKRSS